MFGVIEAQSGLTEAPIKLGEGVITNYATDSGYGYVYIKSRHEKEIHKTGFSSVEEFVFYVASNYDRDNIRVGKRRDNGSSTFLLQIPDKYDNTLFVELSKDGSYWNVNSAGVLRKGDANKKETVAKTEPQQPNNAVSTDSSLSESNGSGILLAEPTGEPTVSSADKVRDKSLNEQNIGDRCRFRGFTCEWYRGGACEPRRG